MLHGMSNMNTMIQVMLRAWALEMMSPSSPSRPGASYLGTGLSPNPGAKDQASISVAGEEACWLMDTRDPSTAIVAAKVMAEAAAGEATRLLGIQASSWLRLRQLRCSDSLDIVTNTNNR